MAQAAVRVDRAREADLGQDRDVVGGVPVRVRRGQVDAFLLGDRAHGVGLGLTVQHVAHQPAGVEAVLVLGDGAQRSGRAEAPGDQGPDLHRGRCDQPDGVPRGDVLVEEALRPGVDPQAQHLVVDVLRDRGDLGHRVPLHDRQRAAAHLVDLVLVLAERQVAELVEPELDQVPLAEEPAPVEAHPEVEGAGAADDRVVDVEERADAGTVRAGPRVPQHGSGGAGVPGRLTHLVTVRACGRFSSVRPPRWSRSRPRPRCIGQVEGATVVLRLVRGDFLRVNGGAPAATHASSHRRPSGNVDGCVHVRVGTVPTGGAVERGLIDPVVWVNVIAHGAGAGRVAGVDRPDPTPGTLSLDADPDTQQPQRRVLQPFPVQALLRGHVRAGVLHRSLRGLRHRHEAEVLQRDDVGLLDDRLCGVPCPVVDSVRSGAPLPCDAGAQLLPGT